MNQNQIQTTPTLWTMDQMNAIAMMNAHQICPSSNSPQADLNPNARQKTWVIIAMNVKMIVIAMMEKFAKTKKHVLLFKNKTFP
jgi:hypothetical protein